MSQGVGLFVGVAGAAALGYYYREQIKERLEQLEEDLKPKVIKGAVNGYGLAKRGADYLKSMLPKDTTPQMILSRVWLINPGAESSDERVSLLRDYSYDEACLLKTISLVGLDLTPQQAQMLAEMHSAAREPLRIQIEYYWRDGESDAIANDIYYLAIPLGRFLDGDLALETDGEWLDQELVDQYTEIESNLALASASASASTYSQPELEQLVRMYAGPNWNFGRELGWTDGQIAHNLFDLQRGRPLLKRGSGDYIKLVDPILEDHLTFQSVQV